MKPLRPPAKRLLCLWLPNWPVQRLRSAIAAAPEAEPLAEPGSPAAAAWHPATPLVLWGNDPRRGRLVVACCERAGGRGVRVGMTMGEADSLVRGGDPPAPEILPHDSEADLEALRELAEACAEELSPIVAIEPLDDFLWAGQLLHQPQSLLLDVTGVGELFGSEANLISAATKLLDRHRLVGRVAIADTAGAAWGLAHYGHRPQAEDGPTTAAAEILVPPGQTRQALAPLPVLALRMRGETAAMLRRLGVQSIDALLRLPRSGLATRLGTDLLRRLDQALGEIDEPLPAHHAVAADRAAVDLEYPTRDRDILRHQVEVLVAQVARGLSQRQRGALRLTCRFQLEKPPAVEIRASLFTPSATTAHLLRLLAAPLEKCRFPSPAHHISVAATLTGPLGTHQPTLSDIGGGEQGSVQDLARLIDGLSSRLGRRRVLGVEPTADPLPEQAVRLRPLTGQPVGAIVPGRPMPRQRSNRTRWSGRRGGRDKRLQPSESLFPESASSAEFTGPHSSSLDGHPAPTDPLRRPLTLLVPAIPLTALGPEAQAAQSAEPAEPAEREGVPDRFRQAGRIHHVVRYWGPERLETGWWSGAMQRRDYYRVETSEGSWLWIYRDLRQHQWWLHGHFL